MTQIDFLPKWYVRYQRQRFEVRYRVAAIALVVLTLLGWGFQGLGKISALKDQLGAAESATTEDPAGRPSSCAGPAGGGIAPDLASRRQRDSARNDDRSDARIVGAHGAGHLIAGATGRIGRRQDSDCCI